MKTAMILSAGRGSRLNPLTNTIPKGLCEVKGKSLIEHHIINLSNAGIKNIIINHAYLGDKIRRCIGNGSQWNVNVTYSPEPPGGLETGGGIINALPILGSEPFLTINADVYTNINFKKLSLPPKSQIHLVLVPNAPQYNLKGDFGISETNLLDTKSRSHTFSGIAIYHPKVLKELEIGRFSIAPIIKQYAKKNLVSAEIFDGQWIAIDSIAALNWINDRKLSLR